jgi:hypothetical protein
MICLLLSLAMATPQLGMLEGYVFRETDGGPPRRPLTVELIEQGRTKYRKTTEDDGSFVFRNVRQGAYAIRARFNDFVFAEDAVIVTGGKNFATVMLPKRRAGARTFRTVTADQLAVQSDRDLQKTLRQAAELMAKGDLAGAVRLYEQAAAAAGAQADVWDGLAVLYFQMGRKDEAFRTFAKAMERDPSYLLAYTHLGTIYSEERQYKELLVVAKRFGGRLEVDDGTCLLGGSAGECRGSGSSSTVCRDRLGADPGKGARTPFAAGEDPVGSAGLRWRAQAHGTLSPAEDLVARASGGGEVSGDAACVRAGSLNPGRGPAGCAVAQRLHNMWEDWRWPHIL